MKISEIAVVHGLAGRHGHSVRDLPHAVHRHAGAGALPGRGAMAAVRGLGRQGGLRHAIRVPRAGSV